MILWNSLFRYIWGILRDAFFISLLKLSNQIIQERHLTPLVLCFLYFLVSFFDTLREDYEGIKFDSCFGNQQCHFFKVREVLLL